MTPAHMLDADSLAVLSSTRLSSSLLTPASAFKGEKWRGLFMSLVSNIFANGLNFALTTFVGLPIMASTVLSLQVFNNLLGYILDILFAKRAFRLRSYNGIADYRGPVPYSDLATRGKWLLRSFVSKQFFRYLITILIDIVVTLLVMRWAIRELDKRKIMMDFKYRNLLLAVVVATLSFFLYVNVLRFEWAYLDDEQPVFNLMVMMWVTLAVSLYAATSATDQDKVNEPAVPLLRFADGSTVTVLEDAVQKTVQKF